jgi:hypothetical protein
MPITPSRSAPVMRRAAVSTGLQQNRSGPLRAGVLGYCSQRQSHTSPAPSLTMEGLVSGLDPQPNSGPELWLAPSHPKSSILWRKTGLAVVADTQGPDCPRDRLESFPSVVLPLPRCWGGPCTQLLGARYPRARPSLGSQAQHHLRELRRLRRHRPREWLEAPPHLRFASA